MKGRLSLDPVRHLAAPAAFLALLSFSVLSVTLPLGGRALPELAALTENVFSPARFVHAVWLVILSGLGAFVLYQFLPSQGRIPGRRRASLLFSVACLLNVAWLTAWHFQWTGLSVAIMGALLVCVFLIYLQVTARSAEATLARRLMSVLPFRLYLGWLLMTTLFNVSAAFSGGAPAPAGLSATAWAFSLFGVTFGLGLLFLFLKNDLFVNLMLIWGLIGVAAGQAGNTAVVAGAAGSAALLFLALVWRVFSRRGGPDAPVPAAAAAPPAPRGAERFIRPQERD